VKTILRFAPFSMKASGKAVFASGFFYLNFSIPAFHLSDVFGPIFGWELTFDSR
jgi:hypothetical protein